MEKSSQYSHDPSLSWRITHTIAITVAFALVSCVAFISHPNIKMVVFRLLFYMALFSATVACIVSIPNTVFGLYFDLELADFLCPTVLYISYLTLIVSSFLFWLLRLYFTFKNSTFQKRNAFWIIMAVALSLTLTLATAGVILFAFGWIVVGHWLMFCSTFCYFVAASIVMKEFAGSLFNLVTNKIITVRMDVQNCSDEIIRQATTDLDLDRNDQTMVHCIEKYLLLGCLSFASTLITWFIAVLVMFAFESYIEALRLALIVDFTNNIVCLYLQFGFAVKHYKTFCGLCSNRAYTMVERRASAALGRASYTFYAKQRDDYEKSDSAMQSGTDENLL